MKIPILFLIFNRPEETFKSFEAIIKYQPDRLFIASDGPRKYKTGEEEVVINLRNKIIDSITWPCSVYTFFRNENLGCKNSIFSSISWFFNSVDYGIVLEDDCLASSDFFSLCEIALPYYENDFNIGSICGFNRFSFPFISQPFIFSKYFNSWGWATWKSRWSNFDLNLNEISHVNESDIFRLLYPNYFERKLRIKRYNDFRNNLINSWATPWSFYLNLYSYSILYPKVNLIKNLGFTDKFSTHTKGNFWDKIFFEKKNRNLIITNNISYNKYFSVIYGWLFIFSEYLRIILKRISIKF